MATAEELTGAPVVVEGVEFRPLTLQQLAMALRRAKRQLIEDRAARLAVATWLSNEEKSAALDEYEAEVDRSADITNAAGSRMLTAFVTSLDGIAFLLELSAGHEVAIPFTDQERWRGVVQDVFRISGLAPDNKPRPTKGRAAGKRGAGNR